MPLFCKQCKSRRLPKSVIPENKTLWLCEKCRNFVNSEDFIVREAKANECENCKNFVDLEDFIVREAKQDEYNSSQEDYKKWVKSIPPTEGTKDSFRY